MTKLSFIFKKNDIIKQIKFKTAEILLEFKDLLENTFLTQLVLLCNIVILLLSR